jgi:hypothetical protein
MGGDKKRIRDKRDAKRAARSRRRRQPSHRRTSTTTRTVANEGTESVRLLTWTTASGAEQRHPSFRYVHPYETAETVFGAPVKADLLIQRVRDYSWAGSLSRLANLAAQVANTPGGVFSEKVRRVTVQALTRLTGDASCSSLLARGRAAIAERGDRMVLAHEEVISFLEHLVVLEGSDASSAPAPGDEEIAFWMCAANGLLNPWSPKEMDDEASVRRRLQAEMTRISRFNSRPDMLRLLARTWLLFGTPPETGELVSC